MPHPSTEALLRFFEYEHLPRHTRRRDTSLLFHNLAHTLASNEQLAGAELTTALRKLLEAKDCAVRAALDADAIEATCVTCGCTEDHACEGGCSWVANDLNVDICSACVAKLAAAAPPA